MAYTRLDSLHLGHEGACLTQEHHVEATMKPELVCRCHSSVQQDLERYVHLQTGRRSAIRAWSSDPTVWSFEARRSLTNVKQMAQLRRP
jgi:hypothetical protein